MRTLWKIPGLPAPLRRVYSALSEARRLVCVGKHRLIVYAGSKVGIEAEIAELIHLGLVEKRKIGKRSIILLGTWEILEKRFTTNGVGVSSVFTADMVSTLERYSEAQQRVIEQAFTAFGSTRKGGHISPGVLLRQLQSYERFPASAVIDGLRIYLEGGHAEQGKKEQYALGIIRGCAKHAELDPVSAESVPTKSSAEGERAVAAHQQSRREALALRDAKVLAKAQELYGPDTQLSSLTISELAGVQRLVEQG